ncbi:hypothetical protein [Mesorhizobium sp.]|uniref:hypothetical protein n=1 Tax=Mesorhizobium sp. TaxID=1871066 RepID=UPI000FEA2BE2|nr:hypothetical protein [Mesorhizobium sp.]RWD63956.1 MAG: hypothetical protein EOS37_28505 [Mesorhizobium sp.]TIV58806.1 MAG: trypsin-like peptidase domain-containing protein [Mesorhizobium sp.]
MHPLPGDDLGRFWVAATPDHASPKEKNVLVTLVAADENGELLVLGNAFVIYAGGNKAICMAAAHSFDRIKYQQMIMSGRHYYHMVDDFRPDVIEFVKTEEIFAFLVIDDVVVNCKVEQLNYIANYDVAVFTIYNPDENLSFSNHVELDLAVPHVGDVVAVLANDISLESAGDGQGQLTQSLHMRYGTVTEVNWDKSPLPGQSMYFQTTIPFTPGMSGAPVMLAPEKRANVAICGVVSADLSEPEAFNLMTVAGRSSVSMIWPALGFGLDVDFDGYKGHRFIGDLVNSGAIQSKKNGIRVTVVGSNDKTDTTYVDNRTNPPSGVVLTTKGHPKI